jgi:hypothetical protein
MDPLDRARIPQNIKQLLKAVVFETLAILGNVQPSNTFAFFNKTIEHSEEMIV